MTPRRRTGRPAWRGQAEAGGAAGGHEPYEKAARRRWKKGVVVKAHQKMWQELTEYSALVELGPWQPARQGWPPCGWAVEHGRAEAPGEEDTILGGFSLL